MLWCKYGGRRAAWQSQFYPATLWLPANSGQAINWETASLISLVENFCVLIYMICLVISRHHQVSLNRDSQLF